jgi:YHS domain-containing protein
MRIRFPLAIAVTVVAFSIPVTGYAADEYNVSSGVTTSGVPLALRGADTVALATTNRLADGEATNAIVNDGVAYYFASAETAEKFEADPEKYLPQFGGFCAYAVALGKKFDGDPKFADIVDGKLYLFVNAAIFEEYKRDKEYVIMTASSMWADIQYTAVDEL